LRLKSESHNERDPRLKISEREAPGSRLIHRHEGRIDKTKWEDHQILVLLINARIVSTN